ncbi:MAG: SPOR domain-containing protein [Eubacteriales bacterium]|nr:SPOR domain-containing protein [Eubacteriales bacterium]MDD4389620.1 SPOR domain-containing protein [Eubacteriales bacterium]
MKRRTFRRPRPGKNTGVNLLGILAIILAAALAGFLLTKFIVYPVILGTFTSNAEQSNPQIKEDVGDTAKSQEKKDVTDANKQADEQSAKKSTPDAGKDTAAETVKSGYCIQFGSFATKTAADELISELSASGIKASAVEKDGSFKVIGEIFGNKEEARTAAASIDKTIYTDIFITDI